MCALKMVVFDQQCIPVVGQRRCSRRRSSRWVHNDLVTIPKRRKRSTQSSLRGVINAWLNGSEVDPRQNQRLEDGDAETILTKRNMSAGSGLQRAAMIIRKENQACEEDLEAHS